MSFGGHRETLIDSVFDELGDPATWTGIALPVRVRRAQFDDEARSDESTLIVNVAFLRVRRREVALPKIGDVAVVVNDAGLPVGEAWRVTGAPRLMRNRVWSMRVAPQ